MVLRVFNPAAFAVMEQEFYIPKPELGLVPNEYVLFDLSRINMICWRAKLL